MVEPLVQKDFNFTKEFFAFLPGPQERVLRRIKATFEDPRVDWELGTKTFLALDCLVDSANLALAEEQVAEIETKLLENNKVKVVKKDLTGLAKGARLLDIS